MHIFINYPVGHSLVRETLNLNLWVSADLPDGVHGANMSSVLFIFVVINGVDNIGLVDEFISSMMVFEDKDRKCWY